MKKAYTLAEILMAMLLITTLSIVAVTTLKSNQGIPNTDLIKFRYSYGTVLDIIHKMSEDQYCYPTENLFARKPADGCEFHTRFKHYINIFEDNVTSAADNETLSSRISQVDKNGKVSSVKPNCFTDNKGVTYCLPIICNGSIADLTCYRSLDKFHIKLYIDKNYTEKRTLYLTISRHGKVSVPQVTYDNVINCRDENDTNLVKQKSYYQCSLAGMLESM